MDTVNFTEELAYLDNSPPNIIPEDFQNWINSPSGE